MQILVGYTGYLESPMLHLSLTGWVWFKLVLKLHREKVFLPLLSIKLWRCWTRRCWRWFFINSTDVKATCGMHNTSDFVPWGINRNTRTGDLFGVSWWNSDGKSSFIIGQANVTLDKQVNVLNGPVSLCTPHKVQWSSTNNFRFQKLHPNNLYLRHSPSIHRSSLTCGQTCKWKRRGKVYSIKRTESVSLSFV